MGIRSRVLKGVASAGTESFAFSHESTWRSDDILEDEEGVSVTSAIKNGLTEGRGERFSLTTVPRKIPEQLVKRRFISTWGIIRE